MKKKILIICIILVILAGIVGTFLFFHFYKKTDKKETITINQTIDINEFYGKRDNITETERVSFLIKGEDLLVGMMGLEPKNEEYNFSEDDMVKFALYVAQERYGDMLESKRNYRTGVDEYYIEPAVIDSIIEEFFGRTDIEYSYQSEEYNYSLTNKKFIFRQDFEKTLWYYPVSQETNDERIVITVDSVYINDDQEDYNLREAKYEGKYDKEKVDSTIKFIYDLNGYLIGYQYL